MKVSPREVHLWYAEYPTEKTLSTEGLIVSPEELSFASKCALTRGNEFLCGRATLRSLLSSYHPGVDALDWVFSPNEFGRLSVPRKGIEFNLSHSKGLVAVAIGIGNRIGVDVEYGHRAGDLQELAESCFSPSELAELKNHRTENFRRRFFQYWTLKEAFVKAVGRGLSIGLDQFSFALPRLDSSTGEAKISVHFEPSLAWVGGNWQFSLVEPRLGYQAAVAVQSGAPTEIRVVECGFLDWPFQKAS